MCKTTGLLIISMYCINVCMYACIRSYAINIYYYVYLYCDCKFTPLIFIDLEIYKIFLESNRKLTFTPMIKWYMYHLQPCKYQLVMMLLTDFKNHWWQNWRYKLGWCLLRHSYDVRMWWLSYVCSHMIYVIIVMNWLSINNPVGMYMLTYLFWLDLWKPSLKA